MDDPARGHVAGGRLDRLAQPDRRLGERLLLHERPARARDRARHSPAVREPGVGRVRDGVDFEGGDVGVEHLD
jgi:hypothetical protein